MKRNWKLVRAILRREDTSKWPQVEVLEHGIMLSSGGFIECVPVSVAGQPPENIHYKDQITLSGLDLGDTLKNESDLDSTLADIERSGVGPFSEAVTAGMKQRAIKRFNSADA